MADLTAKQKRFVDEYLIDLNATQAALRAGYSKANSDKIGSELLGKPRIRKAVDDALQDRSDETKIDARYVLNRLAEIDQMDVMDILDEKLNFKPITEWPKIWRQYVSGIELAELFEGQGDDRRIAGVLKKIKWPDKIRNLELLGKHVNVQAFKEHIEHSGTVNLADRMAAGRRRALSEPEDDADDE